MKMMKIDYLFGVRPPFYLNFMQRFEETPFSSSGLWCCQPDDEEGVSSKRCIKFG
jgi:hypothetical protein